MIAAQLIKGHKVKFTDEKRSVKVKSVERIGRIEMRVVFEDGFEWFPNALTEVEVVR